MCIQPHVRSSDGVDRFGEDRVLSLRRRRRTIYVHSTYLHSRRIVTMNISGHFYDEL